MKLLNLNRITGFVDAFLIFLSILGVLETIIIRGFMISRPESLKAATTAAYSLLVILYLVWVILSIIRNSTNLRSRIPDILLSAFLLSLVFPVHIGGSIVSFRIVVSRVIVFLRKIFITYFHIQVRFNPARVLLTSFFCVIVIGAVILMMPAATVDGHGASVIDAFFTASSATCVTGLIVQDTGSYYSHFGQTIILILIQIGGLGIMTLSTLFAMILGRRLGLREEESMRGILDQSSSVQMYKLIVQIVKITLVLEFAGSVFLYVRWLPSLGSSEALRHSLFHSIAAFCNAGFSLNTANLAGYVHDTYVNTIIILLIVFGGFGFVVIDDLIKNTRNLNPFSLRLSRLSVHTRLVLTTSAFLIISGTLFVFFFEFDNTLLDLSIKDKLIASVFQSVTCRTAGFNTVDTGALRDITLYIFMILMFIGASPASTGGGIKTTTFAVLILAVRSMLTSREKVEIYSRTIPHQTVYKSIAIVIFSCSFFVLFSMLLLATQQGGFIDILFETFSAMGTVGLSTGITGTLNTFGKIVITVLMYIGRVGPLTVALAIGEAKLVNIEYPTTRIAVG